MNILITSSSRKVNLIQSFQKALRQSGINGKVIASDINPNSASFLFADDHIVIPRSDSLGFITTILKVCKENNISLIIPTRDEELPLFSENKGLFKENNILVMVSDVSTIKTCQDKKLFNNFCDKHSIPHPKTYFNLNTNISNIKFPLWAKPRYGKGSKDTLKIDSIEDLAYALRKIPDVIIQEFIDCSEYTIDLFADFEGNIISVVPRERISIFGGESFITRTVRNDILITESINIAHNLNIVGHIVIQCFFNGTDIKFIEVNPRFGGASHCSFIAGAFSPLFLVKLVNGEQLKPMIGMFQDNMTMLRYTEDCFLNKPTVSEDEGNNTIAIDFDRVIHKYSKGWNDGTIYDTPVAGAKEALLSLISQGYQIVIFTARSNVLDVAPWIEKHLGISNIKVTNIKPAAKVYIDDKAIRFTTWKEVLGKII